MESNISKLTIDDFVILFGIDKSRRSDLVYYRDRAGSIFWGYLDQYNDYKLAMAPCWKLRTRTQDFYRSFIILDDEVCQGPNSMFDSNGKLADKFIKLVENDNGN